MSGRGQPDVRKVFVGCFEDVLRMSKDVLDTLE